MAFSTYSKILVLAGVFSLAMACSKNSGSGAANNTTAYRAGYIPPPAPPTGPNQGGSNQPLNYAGAGRDEHKSKR